ncbi:hypothetical protein B0H13DRAFT_2035248 [Mycena leptocephala]|nr:hypothetical protein B0H13DRAFT_2035248 [Mycena leptocephala]
MACSVTCLPTMCSSPSSAVSPCTRELIHSGWVGKPLLERDYEVGVWCSSPASRASHLICNGSLRHEIRYRKCRNSGNVQENGLESQLCLSSIDPLRSDPTVIVSKSTLLFQTQEWSAGKSARPVDSESGWMAGSQRPWNSSSRSRMEGICPTSF